jgi:hypothetical protein
MIGYKPYCGICGKPVENRDTGKCASCSALDRRLDRAKAVDVKPIKKVSKALAKEREVYARLRQKFLLNKWCAYHGRPCLPTEVHHAMGRVGFADDKEIPLLLDVRFFIPVCRQAHEWIEANPKEAKELGYTESRLI